MDTETNFAWGDRETQFFFDLTPDRILDAVETTGIKCTGRCLALNSLENRVYDLEIDIRHTPEDPAEAFRVAKFYRPGRWSRQQIQEEHDFLLDLKKEEIPVVAPICFDDGSTIRQIEGHDIYFTIFPKAGGRNPDELSNEQLRIIGRLLARIHTTGSTRPAEARIRIHPDTYGLQALDFLLEEECIDIELEDDYIDIVEAICETSAPWFDQTPIQRIHGDAHLGNLIYGRQGFTWVDFDDMLRGPCIQDIWLMTPGRDDDARRQRNILLEAYDSMTHFDHTTLRLTEPLRALRYIHFSAWIAKRWQDPIFPSRFPEFATQNYWSEQIQDLEECYQLMTQ